MKLSIYNSLTRKTEVFESLTPGYVGLYVCGPTVYSDAHLGHARPAITFDILFRLLQHLGYKVRYVRNITDVGHLINDSDEGNDKIEQRAKLEQLEPMEIVCKYVNRYHKNMEQLNVLPPSIEPFASGHIPEQIDLVKKIIKSGYGYESEGSVYFDVTNYAKTHNYGELSGRKIEELLENSRELQGQDSKQNAVDFALWKKTTPEHLMKWQSPWSEGVPGWHLECTAMSAKYLGKQFDIHGGGNDLKFPHHEAEIAQSVAAYGKSSVRYWMHNNLITINGQKMGKSLGNFITLDELFSGTHQLLEQAYSPATVRFFILQAHYRGTLDFSNAALQSAEKGLERLMRAIERITKLSVSETSTINIQKLKEDYYTALLDDLNTPILMSHLFETVRIINCIADGSEKINKEDKEQLEYLVHTFVFDILGITTSNKSGQKEQERTNHLVSMVVQLRNAAKNRKDYQAADQIRQQLIEIGIALKDTKNGCEWETINN